MGNYLLPVNDDPRGTNWKTCALLKKTREVDLTELHHLKEYHVRNTSCDTMLSGTIHHQQCAFLAMLRMPEIMLDELDDIGISVESLEQLDLIHISLHRIMVAPAIGSSCITVYHGELVTYLSSVTRFNAQVVLSVVRNTRYTRDDPPFPISSSFVYDILPTVWRLCWY